MEHTKKLTVEEIRTRIKNRSNVEEIQAEVDNLFSYYGDEKSRLIYDLNQVKIQALINLTELLDGMFIGIEGRSPYMNEPGYVCIRFNEHKNFQFPMIFRSDEDLSVTELPRKHVINNIYVRD